MSDITVEKTAFIDEKNGSKCMGCIQIKKLLGYELCVFEREGTLFYLDNIVVIRKTDYTEIFNLDTMRHEIGDEIHRDITRRNIYKYIADHRKIFLSRM